MPVISEIHGSQLIFSVNNAQAMLHTECYKENTRFQTNFYVTNTRPFNCVHNELAKRLGTKQQFIKIWCMYHRTKFTVHQ